MADPDARPTAQSQYESTGTLVMKCYDTTGGRVHMARYVDRHCECGQLETFHPLYASLEVEGLRALLAERNAQLATLTEEQAALRGKLDRARVVMSQAADALESDATLEARRQAFQQIQDQFEGVPAQLIAVSPEMEQLRFENHALRTRIEQLEEPSTSYAAVSSESAEPRKIQYDREGAHATFNGGWHGNEKALKAFHHGMDTVFNLIDANAVSVTETAEHFCIRCHHRWQGPDNVRSEYCGDCHRKAAETAEQRRRDLQKIRDHVGAMADSLVSRTHPPTAFAVLETLMAEFDKQLDSQHSEAESAHDLLERCSEHPKATHELVCSQCLSSEAPESAERRRRDFEAGMVAKLTTSLEWQFDPADRSDHRKREAFSAYLHSEATR